jgi:hypothetical protein
MFNFQGGYACPSRLSIFARFCTIASEEAMYERMSTVGLFLPLNLPKSRRTASIRYTY